MSAADWESQVHTPSLSSRFNHVYGILLLPVSECILKFKLLIVLLQLWVHSCSVLQYHSQVTHKPYTHSLQGLWICLPALKSVTTPGGRSVPLNPSSTLQTPFRKQVLSVCWMNETSRLLPPRISWKCCGAVSGLLFNIGYESFQWQIFSLEHKADRRQSYFLLSVAVARLLVIWLLALAYSNVHTSYSPTIPCWLHTSLWKV